MSLDFSEPVLIVDDQVMMLRLLTGLVKSIGFKTVETFSDGATALARVKELKPILVISDIEMSPMDGIELLRAIRSDAEISVTKVVLTTASHASATAASAVKAGVDAFLLKPFTPQHMRERFARVFKVDVSHFPSVPRSVAG